MNNEEKHCIMDDTEKPIEITEEMGKGENDDVIRC